MSALVVNLYGGPGTGKSTTAAGVFYLLKIFGINCEMAREFAKDKVWEESLRVLDDQLYIFGKQHHKLFRLKDKVDVIITDAPLLLSSHYGGKEPEIFHSLVEKKYNEFNNFDVFLKRAKKYNPAGRLQSENHAMRMDGQIKDLLEDNGEPYIEMIANSDAPKTIAEMVLRNMGIPAVS